MSRMLRALSIGTLLVVAVSVPVSPAAAQQIPSHVRVITGSARILRWLRPANDVLLTVNQGTTLEVLDQEADWYWVVVPPNAHGTRKVGWIRASNVEPFVPPPVMPKEDPRREPQPQARMAPAASAASTTPAGAEDKVTITERRDGTASGANAAGDKKTYTFQDVHFDRNRYAILQQDMETLRAAVAALKADPSLVVDIEGYTCNLGTTKYNLELGVRRANAVKDYLVSEGIAADRLQTVSLGEQHPKHDNSHEDTRRLNRRVALVPKAQRD